MGIGSYYSQVSRQLVLRETFESLWISTPSAPDPHGFRTLYVPYGGWLTLHMRGHPDIRHIRTNIN